MLTTFFGLLQADDKASALLAAVEANNGGETTPIVFDVNRSSFAQVPGSPFAYWVGERLLRLFAELPPVEAEGRTAKVGLMTQDDFRFVRVWTETLMGPGSANRWFPLNKGGTHGSYYRDTSLALDWKDEGRELKAFHVTRFGTSSKYIFSEQYYGRPGITYTQRTQLGFATRAMPAGLVFTHKGPAIISDSRQNNLALLAITNSLLFRLLVSLQISFGSYEVGVIQRTPVPDLSEEDGLKLGRLARCAVELKRTIDTSNEISHVFHLPALCSALAVL